MKDVVAGVLAVTQRPKDGGGRPHHNTLLDQPGCVKERWIAALLSCIKRCPATRCPLAPCSLAALYNLPRPQRLLKNSGLDKAIHRSL
jgi:hypothetical protein